MARMSRDEFIKATGICGMQKKDAEKESDADKVPEKNCGICKHFLETAYMSDGRGSCSILKHGSDIISDPPVFNLEEKNGYMLRILTDASKCKYYEKMEFIDKDGRECSDPQYRRSMRQLQDK